MIDLKLIPGLKGIYYADKNGNIYNKNRKPKKIHSDKDGYLITSIDNKAQKVHRRSFWQNGFWHSQRPRQRCSLLLQGGHSSKIPSVRKGRPGKITPQAAGRGGSSLRSFPPGLQRSADGPAGTFRIPCGPL